MEKLFIYLSLAFVLQNANAQNELNLDFEIVAKDGNFPVGWKSSGAHLGFLDEKIKKKGVNAVRLQLGKDGNSDDQSFYSQTVIVAGKTGKEIIFRGYLKTEDVKSAGIFVRCESGTYFKLETTDFDKMDGRRLTGTNDWTPLIVRLPFPQNLYQVEFGVYVEGKGKVWADDCKFLIDNKLPHLLADKKNENTPDKEDKKTPYHVKKAAEEQKKRDAEKEVRKNKN